MPGTPNASPTPSPEPVTPPPQPVEISTNMVVTPIEGQPAPSPSELLGSSEPTPEENPAVPTPLGVGDNAPRSEDYTSPASSSTLSSSAETTGWSYSKKPKRVTGRQVYYVASDLLADKHTLYRWLYAQEWMAQTEGPTTEGFDKHWEGMSKDMRKVCTYLLSILPNLTQRSGERRSSKGQQRENEGTPRQSYSLPSVHTALTQSSFLPDSEGSKGSEVATPEPRKQKGCEKEENELYY